MLTRQQKEDIVAKLSDQIKESPAAVLADFKGLNASDMNAIKSELREAGSTFQVVKKKLLAIAFKNNDIELDPKEIEGQIAISVSGDETTSAKIIEKAAKSNENIKIVGGVFEQKLISIEEVHTLAKLPSLDELRGGFISLLLSPARNTVGALTSPQQKFVGALQAMADGKTE